MDDLFYELTGEKLHDYFNKYIALHGIWASENKDDGTPRFSASSIAAAGWGVFMLAALKGEDWRIDAGLARLAISGGPLGDGKPFHLEGMGGIHLFRNGEGWDEPHLRLPGVPDGFSARDGSEHADHGHGYIACFPQYDLVIAVRGATIEWSLPDLCEALHLS